MLVERDLNSLLKSLLCNTTQLLEVPKVSRTKSNAFTLCYSMAFIKTTFK
jgi:hypothetical protein